MTQPGLDIPSSSGSEEQARRNLSYFFRKIHLKLCINFWTLKLPLMARTTNLERLLQNCAPISESAFMGFSANYVARRVHKAVRRPRLMQDRPCLREGLLLFRFLNMAGFPATLHFGVDRTSISNTIMNAHCWVCLDNQIYLPPDDTMVEISRYCVDAKSASNGKLAVVRSPATGAVSNIN